MVSLGLNNMKFSQLPLFKILFSSIDNTAISRPARIEANVSNQHLNKIWQQLINTYFPNDLNLPNYTVVWSRRRQKRTLASCCLIKKRVTVAKELNYPAYTLWLEPLLYHEMCHAVLGSTITKAQNRSARRSWHGADFRILEKKHPLMSAFDLWIKDGGWHSAIRSDRAINAHKRRQSGGS